MISAARNSIKFPYGYVESDHWPNGIDLKKFLLEFQSNSKDEALNRDIENFLKLYDASVFSNVRDKNNERANGSYGIAIYFPLNAEIKSQDPDGAAYDSKNSVNPVAFVNEQFWPIFLQKFYNSRKK